MRRPHDRDLDDEIRGHLAIAIKERIDRGEDPEAARVAAYREFGYIPQVHDSMRRVWYGRWFDAAAALVIEMRIGLRSLMRSKGLAATVVITLALGIGANAAIFSVVRGVLLRPLVNRDEDRLVYIRQGAPGIGADNITFSVPEIDDLKSRVTTISAFGDFSVIEFVMSGLGSEPRSVRAGVVSGSFFEVMGLRPVLGRLLTPQDDGPEAAGAVVLTYRFWATEFHREPSVIGKTITLATRAATVVGVLEPSVPYPSDTEIIANIVTSEHHMEATMQTNRSHRMTELFGRLAPGTTLEAARAELVGAHARMVAEHPETYVGQAAVQLTMARLREQIVAPARTVLVLLLASAAIVFLIACSNVANLILARSVRREGELAVRAALGASRAALRRTLLAESLVLCGAGAALGVLIARPFVSVVAGFAAQFSVRALDVTVDASLLWVGALLAMTAAVLLAYIPRLPSAHAPTGLGLASSGIRMTPATNRRLRIFATTQIAFSFVLLAGAATVLLSLIAVQSIDTGYDMRQVVVFDVPPPSLTYVRPDGYREVAERVAKLPGVRGVALGGVVPWRDDENRLPPFQFSVEGYTPPNGEQLPHARMRYVGTTFFSVLGVPIVAGRSFTDHDRRPKGDTREPVVIVSQTLAKRLFPNGNVLNREFRWTDPVLNMRVPSPVRRIVGVVADVDDESVVPGPVMAAYIPGFEFGSLTGRLFVQAEGDPLLLVPEVRKIVHEVVPDQPVENAATLETVRAKVLEPERLNAFVLSGFAGVAMLIAVVGVAGVLAFSVSARMREIGVRLAIGSSPRRVMGRVLFEGASIVGIGIVAGAIGAFVFKRLAAGVIGPIGLPGMSPLAGAAVILLAAAVLAALMPAVRAARVDVLQALRAE